MSYLDQAGSEFHFKCSKHLPNIYITRKMHRKVFHPVCGGNILPTSMFDFWRISVVVFICWSTLSSIHKGSTMAHLSSVTNALWCPTLKRYTWAPSTHHMYHDSKSGTQTVQIIQSYQNKSQYTDCWQFIWSIGWEILYAHRQNC